MRSAGMPGRTMIATVHRSVLICAIVALAAGCGLQKAPGSGGSGNAGTSGGSGGAGTAGGGRQHHGHGVVSQPTSGSPTASVSACTITDVQVTVDTHAAGVAAGSSYLPLDFTNTSSASCRLAGFPAVMTASGKAGGQTAHIWLRVVEVANIPKAQCDPVAVAGLWVGLPGEQQTTYIGHQLTTCAKRVRGTEVLTVEPFRPGSARPGTAR
jgi:hypothetical protein